ncbi:MAG: protein kinase [Planctomycetaceae bacterium]
MSEPEQIRHPQLSLQDQLLIDGLCDRLEASLKGDRNLSVEMLLKTCAAHLRPVALRCLLMRELETLPDLGESPELAAYVRRFPKQTTLLKQLFEKQKPDAPQVPSADVSAIDTSQVHDVLQPTLISPAQDSPNAKDDPNLHGKKTAAESAGQKDTGLIGQTLGNYHITRILGQGGMGTVYAAEHIHLKNQVALKVLASHLTANEEIVRRFRREMVAVGRLNHKNIVRALDGGEIGGRQFLVMDFVEGPDLSTQIRQRGPLSLLQALMFIRSAAVGLKHAHENGLVHRDIKPSNLLYSTKDRVIKLLDLGLARLTDSVDPHDAGLTGVGQVLGTPEYMAPEQWTSHEVDPRTDIYALGGTFYFLQSGRSPFRTGNDQSAFQFMHAHATQDPPDLPQSNHPVFDDVNRLYQRMMAKDIGLRPASAEELIELIDQILERARQQKNSGSASSDVRRSSSSGSSREPQSQAARSDAKLPGPATADSAPVPEEDFDDNAAFDDQPPKLWRRLLPLALVIAACGIVLAVVFRANQDNPTGGTSASVNQSAAGTSSIANPGTPDTSGSGVVTPGPGNGDPTAITVNQLPIAEWVFSVGGQLSLSGDGSRMLVSRSQLPSGSFDIAAIDLSDCRRLKDEDLARIGKLPLLSELNLARTPISDAGLLRLKSLNSLELLNLQACPVTSGGMVSLANLTDLTELVLLETAVADDGFGALEKLNRLQRCYVSGSQIDNDCLKTICESFSSLEYLFVERSSITDLGLVHLRKLTNLKTLSLTLAPVTDAGTSHLVAVYSLQQLLIQGTQISSRAVAEIQRQLPTCRVYGGRFDERRGTVARILSLGGKLEVITSSGPQRFESFEGFPEVDFEVEAVDLSGIKTLRPGDARSLLFSELKRLSLAGSSVSVSDLSDVATGCPFLTELNIAQTEFHDEDVGTLSTMKLFQLTLSEGQISSEGIRRLKMLLPQECELVFVP